MAKSIKCKKCKSSNIQMIANDTNIKTKTSTSLNLNPLKPFTIFNSTEKKKKKTSKGKLAAGLMTGGASLLVTGVKDNKGREFLCTDCGYTFKSK